MQAEVVDEPHRPGDIPHGGGVREPEHPPGKGMPAEEVGIEVFRGAADEVESDPDHGEEVDQDDETIDEVKIHDNPWQKDLSEPEAGEEPFPHFHVGLLDAGRVKPVLGVDMVIGGGLDNVSFRLESAGKGEAADKLAPGEGKVLVAFGKDGAGEGVVEKDGIFPVAKISVIAGWMGFLKLEVVGVEKGGGALGDALGKVVPVTELLDAGEAEINTPCRHLKEMGWGFYRCQPRAIASKVFQH